MLEELSPAEEFPESVGDTINFRGSIDLSVNADVGDILALAGPCDGLAVAAATIPASPGRGDTLPGLFFTLSPDKDAAPGMELNLGEALSTMPPAWSFSYGPHQWPTRTLAATRRSGGSLQILVRVRGDAKCMGEQALLNSLRTFSHRCEWALRYPLYVLHTARLEGVSIQELLAWTDLVRGAAHPELQLRFLDVSEEFSRVRFGSAEVELGELDLLWMDLTSPRSEWIRKEKPRRFKVGYRHMCRFHSSTIMDLPAFAATRYVMHIDEDAALQCQPGTAGPDPLEEMARSNAVYGLFEVGTEDPAYTVGWTGFIKEYVLLHEVKPSVPMELLSHEGALVTKEDDDHPGQLVNVTADDLAVTWGTAWEVLDLEFFLSTEVKEFTEKVERSLGHYRHSWGDHLVRAYQVQLFAPLDRIRCFDAEELPGTHGCNDPKQEMGGEFLYRFAQDLACPQQWTAEVLYDVPWHPTDSSPRLCLLRCNQLSCEGFDFVYFGSSSTIHCILRDRPSDPETCLSGGVEGSAGQAWRRIGVDMSTASFVGSTIRYQLIERNAIRTLNCTRWRSELEASLSSQ